jgi:hypothetical protein
MSEDEATTSKRSDDRDRVMTLVWRNAERAAAQLLLVKRKVFSQDLLPGVN